MDKSSSDLRVVKTRAAIQSHFLELLLQKNFNEITVIDIAKAANIGRGTFYLHYIDKFDLLEKVMEEGLSETVSHFQPETYFDNGRAIPDRMIHFVLSMFGHFRENERFFRAMLFNKGIPNFKSRMQQLFLSKFRREISSMVPMTSGVDPITMEILPVFISSGMIGLVEWWFRNNMRISEKDMARKIFQVMTRGPLQTLGFTIEEKNEH
ncbi:TetR/AcrR family transcriptional regulator [Sporolactobacillus shoreae]|uniref:TetR/AcrR family transcriptional regulator n=1 Tax=Sporolactobacillus shoreae TaxID=1465501 RepID=A0A4Z0GNL2_9BACL|nr:TetR/AcrR family transcriptional regulator [Sporolactobacillus shoreae]TGA97955.1 TetR/AcrR family transcriptional regulator [Sporolactobacillus shoreae]